MKLIEDMKNISDGNHTFEELYDHRAALLYALMKSCRSQKQCWISKFHNDGTMFDDDLFIAGIDTRDGKQITYHCKLKWWDKFTEVATPYVKAPSKWDGHTSEDVIERLLTLEVI